MTKHRFLIGDQRKLWVHQKIISILKWPVLALGKLQWILCGNPASREHLVGRKILITIISHESNEYQER